MCVYVCVRGRVHWICSSFRPHASLGSAFPPQYCEHDLIKLTRAMGRPFTLSEVKGLVLQLIGEPAG